MDAEGEKGEGVMKLGITLIAIGVLCVLQASSIAWGYVSMEPPIVYYSVRSIGMVIVTFDKQIVVQVTRFSDYKTFWPLGNPPLNS